MARKTTAKKTPPKKQTQTTHAKVVEDELVEDDDAIEDVASRNEKKGKVVLGKRKGVVIEESENEDLEPRQIVALKKKNGKRAMAKEKEGKLIQPKAIKFDKKQMRIIKEKEVEGHGNPAALYELIQLLTPAQKKDVEDIGFGGLLELKTNAFYHLMADWLMECYDDVSQMFMFSEKTNFVITKHDVYDVFMLPCTEMEVRMTSSKKKENPDEGLVEAWRARYNVGPKKDISLDRLRREMLDLVDGGNMFKRLFVLFSMGSFFAPMVHNRVDLRLVRAVEDVEDIVRQDWCSYVLHRLSKAVESYRKFDTTNVGGCLLFLQLVYLHRLSWKGNPANRELPLVKHWTYDDINDRVKEEKLAYSKNGGHFGTGSHDLDVAAPRTITLPLAAGLLTDEELRFKYPDIRVLKWMTTKRNLELVSKLHNDMTKDLEAFVSVNVVLDEVVQAEEVENGEQPPEVSSQFSWTQALMDPSFLDDFHALGKKVDELLKINLVEPPSFDLGLDDVHIQEKEARGDAVEDPIHANENTVVERFRRRYSRAAKKEGRKA
ncbi:hypothetical protein KSS87_009650 [Heliosperma pusillum]|nr:hypothetical protein KSS87_009650 [Heliosperma pusillum]